MLFTVLLLLLSPPVSLELDEGLALVALDVALLATNPSFPSKSGRFSVTRAQAPSAVVLLLFAKR